MGHTQMFFMLPSLTTTITLNILSIQHIQNSSYGPNDLGLKNYAYR